MHPAISCHKVGVLLVNLGTPDSTSTSDVRRYLKEFLSDHRIIDLPPIIWKTILYLLVLPFRPSKTAHAYKQIWLQPLNESPLRFYTRQQAEKLSFEFKNNGSIMIDWAMRYGNPSVESRLQALKKAGCMRIAIVPLYPQYSATTTASVHDAVFSAIQAMRWQPAIRIAEPYHDNPIYIQALAKSIKNFTEELVWKPDVVLASFHGIPARYLTAGDPYSCFCSKTTRLLREALGWDETQLQHSYQSRFGKAAWLEPYTEQHLAELAKSGKKKVAVICPGFAVDCVETLEEINIRARKVFIENGGTHFAFIPCLNDSSQGIGLLSNIVKTTIAGWSTVEAS